MAGETANSVPVKTVKVKLKISKDTEMQYRPFSFMTHPMQAIQVLVESAKSVGIYQDSKDLSSKENACLCTLNFDKGGDTINGSVSCRTVERGNSRDKTITIASVEGGSECHENMENTFFNSEYPICQFTHQFVSGSLWILSITKPKKNNNELQNYHNPMHRRANNVTRNQLCN